MASPVVRKRDIMPRNRIFTAWERQRNRSEVHWMAEMFAEMLGVFFYVYAGVSSTAGFVVGNIIQQPLSSLQQIGFAYAFGVLFAIGIAGATSGGHFSPCITIVHVLFNGFPRMKAVRYIVAQILGAYIACALIYNQWKEFIVVAEEALVTAKTFDALMYTPNGPAGIFGLYLPVGQTLGRAFLNEAAVVFFVGIITWACMDPSNYMVPPVMAQFFVSMAYGVAIWGFAVPGIALNTARDVGGRLFSMTIWGMPATGGKYAAIAALTNIIVTIFAVVVYEIFLADSDRVVPPASLDYFAWIKGHGRYTPPHTQHPRQRNDEEMDSDSSKDSEKPSVTTYEVAPKMGYESHQHGAIHSVPR
ncbi:putative aquaporin 2 [Crucibulum laeve]|uniref:Putative aquaporin 2 n=1 Tax=Crucibulum laeve TaxID=68775 RepID=A0A5C3M4W6_9AGAR|nr:putative aquaporin 2 [Crucibulum laeve]